MKKLTWGIVVLLAAVSLVGSLSLATAQEVTAGITGTVVDPTGAAVKGATATATDTERGTAWTAQTNDSGFFSMTRLPVGTYKVHVAASGFQGADYPAFTLVLNQTASLNFQMKVGQTSETVEVTGAAPVLQTQSAEVSTVIDANTAVSMPLASRNYLQLTLLAPGTTNVDPDGMRQPQSMTDSGRPYINGNREQANEYLLDGILNSEDKNNEVGYTPGIDAIQEFNLITQNASAEFGNYQGGVISAEIKSGTNNFHGDLFEFFRNDALDANLASSGWTQGVDNGQPGFNAQGVTNKPELRYNQFGGTIGGPIIKNKLFFFADYQGQRLVDAGVTGAQVLTARARTGDFGQLCTDPGGTFSGGVCTGGTQLVFPVGTPNAGQPIPNNNLAAAGIAINPVSANIFADTKNYPLPGLDNLAGNNLFYNSGNSLNNNQGDLKLDYVLSSKDHIFGRWSQMDLNQPTFSGCPLCNAGSVEGSDEPVRNSSVDWTHTFGANLLNEARFGFNAVSYDAKTTPASALGNIGESLGIAGANLQVTGLPLIAITGAGGGSPNLGLINLVSVFHSTQGQLEDNLVFTRGRHQIKTGFQFVRERQDYVYTGNEGALGTLAINTLTGSGLADFYMGNLVGGAGSSSNRDTGGVLSNGPAQLRGNVYAAFVQDDWRVTNSLTVNLGVRFEDHAPLAEARNREVNFGLFTGTIYTATGVDDSTKFGNRALYNNYLGIGDWEPRFGVAWTPPGLNGKTVIRAGFGISSYTEGGGTNEELTLNAPFGVVVQNPPGSSTSLNNLQTGFGPPPALCQVNFACYAGSRIRIFDQNFKPAMVSQWNLTIQQQLSNSLTFQIGYVGQRGAHLLNFQDNAQSIPLNAAGKVAGAGDTITTLLPGPFLGGGAAGSLYLADNPQFNPAGCGTTPPTITGNPPCGREALAGTNMSNSDQKYNALQAVLQKRMGNGLTGQVAYTWSKCMSNSPGFFGTGFGSTQATSSGGQPGWENIYNPRLDWGPCYYDQTHIVTSYVTYALPLGHGKRFGHDLNPVLNGIIGNWEIGGIVSLHTGNALTFNNFGGWGVGGNSDNTNGVDPYTLAGLPDCNGPVKVVNQRVNSTGPAAGYIQYISPASVSIPAPNTFGTCSVGNVRGPAYANVDLSLHKDVLITETKRLEIRFEGLNALNHPVWNFSQGPANGTFDPGSPIFGRITSSQGARQLQFGLKFYF